MARTLELLLVCVFLSGYRCRVQGTKSLHRELPQHKVAHSSNTGLHSLGDLRNLFSPLETLLLAHNPISTAGRASLRVNGQLHETKSVAGDSLNRMSAPFAHMQAEEAPIGTESGVLALQPVDASEFFQMSQELLKLPASALAISKLTDAIDYPSKRSDEESTSVLAKFAQFLKRQRRSQLLTDLLKSDRQAYLETAQFLNIPRSELPNREDIPIRECDLVGMQIDKVPRQDSTSDTSEDELVPDCVLEKRPVEESFLDRFLLKVMRNLYVEEARIAPSPEKGIRGLLDEVQRFMLSPQGAEAEAQQQAVVKGLRTLMSRWTPFLLPFFRIVMGGIVPSYDPDDKRTGADPKWLADSVQWIRQRLPIGKEYLEPGKQLGPPVYAVPLMALVASVSIRPLAGPFTLNLRRDGKVGGLVAERCIFLQESNCKGMCLNSCKVPAEQLFDELGLPLRVSPNFETQECNWAFGEKAPPLAEDPSWPKGCVIGCTSRTALKELKRICE